MKEFKSEWAVVGTREGLTTVYIGRTKEWCMNNCNPWCDEEVFQYVEGAIYENTLRFKGTKRYYRSFLGQHKYYDLSIPEVYEVEPGSYDIKQDWVKKKKYILFKNCKICLDRRADGRKREVTTSVFKLNDAGV